MVMNGGGKLHTVEIVKGKLYLDKNKITNLKQFSLVSSEVAQGIAELTMKLDVAIDPSENESEKK